MICSSSESVPLKSNVIARGRVLIGRPSYAALAVPALAFEPPLAAALLPAFLDPLLPRAPDPGGRAALAPLAPAGVFAPAARGVWRAGRRDGPLLARSAC